MDFGPFLFHAAETDTSFLTLISIIVPRAVGAPFPAFTEPFQGAPMSPLGPLEGSAWTPVLFLFCSSGPARVIPVQDRTTENFQMPALPPGEAPDEEECQSEMGSNAT